MSLAHGTQCEICEGTGTVEVEIEERHPWGSTFATEYLVDVQDCTECNGLGYHLDSASCIVCGKPVAGKGIAAEGWEVHEECASDWIPRLDGGL